MTPAEAIERLERAIQNYPPGPSKADLSGYLEVIRDLNEALAPFTTTRWGALLPDDEPLFPTAGAVPRADITAGDFRRARRLLGKEP